MAYEKFDHGPLQEYAITWRDGTMEVVKAHQVLLPQTSFIGGDGDPNVRIHGEIDGRWMLVLSAPGDQIISIRLLQPAKDES